MRIPLVTIVMPVYNAEKYLRDSIDSVLNQTFTDFCLLIINDGSVDNSEKIVLSYSDERIKYLKNPENLGIVQTLNKGFDLVSSKYIARMDADDICSVDRIKLQIEMMEADPELALIGTWAELIDENGNRVGALQPPCSDSEIKTALLFSNVFIHSSVMIRRDVLVNNQLVYRTEHKAVEDYGLWVRIAFNHKVAILNKTCIRYRLNPSGIMSAATKDKKRHLDNKTVVYELILNILRIDDRNSEYPEMLCQFSNGVGSVLQRIEFPRFLNALSRRVFSEDKFDKKYYRTIISGLLRTCATDIGENLFHFAMLVQKAGFQYIDIGIEVIKFLCTEIKHRLNE